MCHAAFGALVVLALAGAGCSTGETSAVPQREIIRIGIPEGDFGSSDIGMQQFTRIFSDESLVEVGPNGRPVPSLAEGWQWESGGLGLRIRLRQGVMTHEGAPLTSSLVTDALREATAKPPNRELYMSLSAIDRIEARADNEVAISLNRQAGALPEDLNIPLTFGPNKSGTGPYRVAERTGPEFVLERFDKYYGGQPAIENVVIRPYKTVRTAWSGLLRGEIDMVTNVPADATEFLGSDRIAVTSYFRDYQYGIAFNSQRRPMSAPAVRRALNLAIDRDRLVKVVLGGRGRPASGPLWPQHWALQGADRAYTFDPVEAQAVLDRAGLPRKRQSESDRQQVRFAFTCLIPANFRTEERLALEIQKQLYDVGVDVEFEALPPPEYVKRITSGDFDAVFLEMVGGPTLSRPFLLWRSARRFKGFYNTFGYENGEAEELFDVLQQTTDEDRIRTAARRLQALFLEDPPALFVAWNEQLRAVSRDFRIVQDAGRDPIFTLWRWQSN